MKKDIHPNYRDEEVRLVAETLDRAEARAVRFLVPVCDERHIAVARDAGMNVERTLSDYCTVGGDPIDLLVLVSR